MADDPRPPLWVGHVTLPTTKLDETREFMLKIGMRDIVKGEKFAVFELRGGTHLIVAEAEEGGSGPAYFDLMVEDIDESHAHYASLGLGPSEMTRGEIHSSFTLASPSGHTITVNSTHVSDLPV